MKLSVDRHPVFATTGGADFDPAKPAVIFLHGAGFDRTAWRLQTRWFAHHGRSVLAVDFPAHGWSDGPALDTVAAMADWTAALIAAAGLKQAALVGHSMGALVAVETAARFPDKVRALGLCTSITNARYRTITEVYPDSPRATAEQCNAAQVAAVRAAIDFALR